MPAKSRQKAKRIGDIQIVTNTARRFGQGASYYFTRLQLPDGSEYPFLFTESQLDTAARRARENREDLLDVSAIRDLVD